MTMEHGHTAEEITQRLSEERRANYVRDWVYGGIDGAITTFAIVAGVIGAALSAKIIIILGLANLLADGLSMAASNYSGTKAEVDDMARLREVERRHIALTPDGEREEIRQMVKSHVALTHRHSNVLRAADCLARLMLDLAEGITLREAVKHSAGDWFSTKKATGWTRQEDRVIVGRKISTACYIDQAFPAALYLAWKYHDDFEAAITANALVGGDSCHRGAVVGALTGLAQPEKVERWTDQLVES